MKSYEIIKIEYNGNHPNKDMEGYHAIISESKTKYRLCRIINNKPNIGYNSRFRIMTLIIIKGKQKVIKKGRRHLINIMYRTGNVQILNFLLLRVVVLGMNTLL